MSWSVIGRIRERLSREQGAVLKDWGGRLPIALVYPSSYYIGMSSLGVHLLYRLLNSYDDVVCERVFYDKDSPPLSLESQRPLADFAVLAFSVTYELDYLNIVPLLRAGGVPLYAADRDERHPLVIAGGPCVIANPMPLSPFFDVFCIGEAEPMVPPLLSALREGIGGKRSDLLQRLASLAGVYVPRVPPEAPVVRQWARHLDESSVTSVILTPDTELGDLYLIEVQRGCNWACCFCLVSSAFGPTRFRSLDRLLAQGAEGLKHRKRIGLVGPSVSDHPQIEELALGLREMGAGLSASSLRVKNLPGALVEALVGSGAHTLTLAPEAGSQRLRDLIRKGISEDDVLEAVARVGEAGARQLKLYFMVGLPTETEEDIEAIARLTLRCKETLEKRRSACRLSLNISPFVPKAGTPFQRQPMAPVDTLEGRIARLKSRLAPRGVKIRSESPAWSQVQGVLARGDATLAQVLAGLETVSLAGWRRASGGIDTDAYVHTSWVGRDLPWEVLVSGGRSE